ncbi:MAG: ABC-three component system middle component 8 [Spirochaetota bacterium]
MLKPDKHTDIKYSVVYLLAVMMKEIQVNGIIKYDDLKNSLISKIGNRVNENFSLALSLLYLLGEVSYLADTDSIKAE